jgi:hypothetical protein
MGKEIIEGRNGAVQECTVEACRLVKILESRTAVTRDLLTRDPLMANSHHHLHHLIHRIPMGT